MVCLQCFFVFFFSISIHRSLHQFTESSFCKTCSKSAFPFTASVSWAGAESWGINGQGWWWLMGMIVNDASTLVTSRRQERRQFSFPYFNHFWLATTNLLCHILIRSQDFSICILYFIFFSFSIRKCSLIINNNNSGKPHNQPLIGMFVQFV